MAMHMWVKLKSYYSFVAVLKFYLFLAMLGLCCYMEALLVAGCRPLIVVASVPVEHKL